MVSESPTRSRLISANLLRVTRLGVFLFGAYTTGWNFFSLIGVLIGLFYYLGLRDPAWKRHGIVLAWDAGITSFVLILIGLSNATGGPSISLTSVAVSIGPGALATYGIVFAVWQGRVKKRVAVSSWVTRITRFRNTMSRKGRFALTLGIILVPVAFWWSLNVNLNVIIDNNMRLLWVHAPSTVENGTDFIFTVEAWDRYERVSATYTGTTSFALQSYNLTDYSSLPVSSARLPEAYTFTGQALPSDKAYEIRDGKDNGLHAFSARIDTPGIHYLLINDSYSDNVYWSNPIIAQPLSPADLRVYWGDIHAHSELSDGSGSSAHHYFYARNVACLDYAALTDHGEIMQFLPGTLYDLERASNLANIDGQFVAFGGIEWTQTRTGHLTLVFSGDQLPRSSPISFLAIPSPSDLWATLDQFTAATGCQVLVIPHHTTRAEYIQDWTYLNPKYVKFAEVTSVQGECLFEQRHPLEHRPCGDPPATYTSGSSVMDALIMGYHFALAANSDEHDGHPGHSLSHTDAYVGHQYPMTTWVNRVDLPYPGGLTAVRSTNLTRAAVFAGLQDGQIYATSDHGRPFMDFAINGTRVGGNSTLTIPSPTATREITVMIAQDGAPAANKRPNAASITPNWAPNWNVTIQILKNGNLLANISVTTPIALVTYLDSTPVTGTSYGVENCTLINGRYYINSFSDNPIDPATLTTQSQDFYVIRAVGENGRIVYAGAIWVAAS
nr:DUF3604 domain-containing protein [Candidatus Sigynarchaeota archaeon]